MRTKHPQPLSSEEKMEKENTLEGKPFGMKRGNKVKITIKLL